MDRLSCWFLLVREREGSPNIWWRQWLNWEEVRRLEVETVRKRDMQERTLREERDKEPPSGERVEYWVMAVEELEGGEVIRR